MNVDRARERERPLERADVSHIQSIHALRSLFSANSVSAAAVAALSAHATPVRITRGTRITADGRPSDVLYVVLEGELSTSRNGKPLGTFGPRAAVGVLPMLARDAGGFTIEALSDTVALSLRAEDVLEVLEDHFDMLLAVMQGLAQEAVAVRQALPGSAGFAGELLTGVDAPSEPLDLVERLFYLRQTFPLGHSHLDALAEIARASHELHYPAGTRLWVPGDRASHLLILVSGVVQGETATGAQFRFGPRDVVGSLDMVAQVPRWFEARVEEDVVALVHDRETLVDLWEDHPELGLDFLQMFSAALLSLREQLGA